MRHQNNDEVALVAMQEKSILSFLPGASRHCSCREVAKRRIVKKQFGPYTTGEFFCPLTAGYTCGYSRMARSRPASKTVLRCGAEQRADSNKKTLRKMGGGEKLE
jgi:hypothetical protein